MFNPWISKKIVAWNKITPFARFQLSPKCYLCVPITKSHVKKLGWWVVYNDNTLQVTDTTYLNFSQIFAFAGRQTHAFLCRVMIYFAALLAAIGVKVNLCKCTRAVSASLSVSKITIEILWLIEKFTLNNQYM